MGKLREYVHIKIFLIDRKNSQSILYTLPILPVHYLAFLPIHLGIQKLKEMYFN